MNNVSLKATLMKMVSSGVRSRPLEGGKLSIIFKI